MDRMKTLLSYALLIIVFFAVSILLENGLLRAMYVNISGTFDGYYQGTDGKFTIQNVFAEASNVSGYMSFELVNKTGKFIDKCYVKIDLYNERNLLADTEYIELLGVQPDYKKQIDIKFKANNIEKFAIAIVENVPDKTNIINVLGWEIDLSNVFGLGIDLTNVTIFGTKLTEIFSWQNIKTTVSNSWNWFMITAQGVPGWGYAIGWLFIIGLL